MTAVAAHELRRDPLGAVAAGLEGSRRELRVGRRRLVLVADPAGAREALVTASRALVKQNYVDVRSNASGMGAAGALLSDDERVHLTARRLYGPFFASRSVAAFDRIVEEEARTLVDRWAAERRTAVGPGLRRFATRVALRSIFEHDPPAADRTAEDVADVLAAFRLAIGDRRTRLGMLDVRLGYRFARALGRLDARMAAFLDTPIGRAGADRADASTRAADLRGILIAAVDTTASALAWSIDALARDESLAEAARAAPEALFAETLRLRPPAWYIGRRATAELELAGTAIRPGDLVWVLPYAIHRDPELWDEPARWAPSRFAGGVDEPTQRFAYLPFGAGTRKCMGEQLAWSSGVELLRQVGGRLRVRTADGPLPALASATLRPARPVVVEMEER